MRILLLRTSALGDVVHCLPVLTALRRHLPTARIGWVVERSMAPLLAGHPDLDEVIEVGLRPWRKRPFAPSTVRDFLAFTGRLNDFAAEVVLDLMGNHKAGALAALARGERTIGLARPHRREPSSAAWLSEEVPPLGEHAVERALSVLSALGLPPEPADFGGERLLPEASADGPLAPADEEPGFVLLHPGTNWGNKSYPAERWGEAIRLLAAEGVEVRVTGGPGEEGLVHSVLAAAGEADGRVRELPTPSLAAMAAAQRRAGLVLGGDTGPVHLARALGRPVVAVMGPTDPATHGPYREDGSEESTVAVLLPCSFCHKRMDEPKACLLSIPPARVAETVLRRLGR